MNFATKYIYGPVKSWRSGTSLGIDPIGEVSTCSFNCAYCQLGQIQSRTAEVKVYVPTEKILEDFLYALEAGEFKLEELDVITFAGSGEPTLALNLAEIIDGLHVIMSQKGIQVPISILTNATLFNDDEVCCRALKADLISLKLDAPNDEVLRSINQPVEGVTVASIISGIKNLVRVRGLDCDASLTMTELQMQIMLMPKFLKQTVIPSETRDPMQNQDSTNLSTGSFGLRPQDDDYVRQLAQIVKDLGVKKIQINTPTRPKPVSKTGEYWIETRGNHYSSPAQGDCRVIPDGVPRNDGSVSAQNDIEFKELPVITREQAQEIEKTFREIINDPDLEIINVYKE